MAISSARSLTKGRTAGAPLPRLAALTELHDGHFKFRFRQSEITLIASQPNSWKSGFALWLASQFNVPTLYFCADSSAWTASTRLVAAYTGEPIASVAKGLREVGEGYYEDILADSPIRFCFDPNPTSDTIREELDAWVEMFDTYPQLIVVDNLMDVVGAGDNEFAAYKDVLLGLKTIARATEASIIVLHHMTEASTDPYVPAPRKALMGKVAQTPENVLSVAMDEGEEQFLVSVVKHRSGPKDAQGKRYVTFRVHPDRNQLEAAPVSVPFIAPPAEKWWEKEVA